MSPNQRENPDPYQENRSQDRTSRQGATPPQQGNPQGTPTGPQQGIPQQATTQGGPQGPPPEQFRGQQSPQPGGQGRGQQGAQPQQHHQPQGQQGVPTQAQPRAQAGTAQPAQPGPQQGQPHGMGRRMQRPKLQSAPVDEVLATDVVTVQRDTPITQVVETMASEDVGDVVVLEDEEPVDILTDRKIALSLGEAPDVSETTADDLISGDLIAGTTEMSVFEVLSQLEEAGIRRLPILDEEGTLAGIVTLDDVIVLLNAELSNAASIIESQSPRF